MVFWPFRGAKSRALRVNCPAWKVQVNKERVKFESFALRGFGLSISINGRCWACEESKEVESERIENEELRM